MTLVKAQACIGAIIGAGFNATAEQVGNSGDWKVRAIATATMIDSTQIDSLVSSQAVVAKVSQVEFS